MKDSGFKSTLPELEREFSLRKINTESVGFYDEPNFLIAERRSPAYLENYAAYVELKNYSDTYIKKAAKEIPFIAQLLHTELVKDGRLGACVDTSLVLGRILEHEGFWNYLVKGSLTIKFPTEAKLENRYFWSIDTTQFAAAHAWVVAPPFNIIDITVKQQPFFKGEEKWLPPFVIHSDYKSCNINEDDIISPEARMIMKMQGMKGALLPHTKDNFGAFIRVFKPNLVEIESLTLKYMPAGISAPDEPLARITSLNLSGKLGFEIYDELIKPKLSEFRNNS
jgi:hypothetical protein